MYYNYIFINYENSFVLEATTIIQKNQKRNTNKNSNFKQIIPKMANK